VKRWLIGGAVVAALVAGATGLAASSAGNEDLGRTFLGAKMARAEIILVNGGVVHDWRLDQGRVVAVRPASLDLVEKDGTRVTVPVAPSAAVTLNGHLAPLLSLRKGMTVLTAHDGGAPAVIVRARARLAAAGP
jgi:hypothetical protein